MRPSRYATNEELAALAAFLAIGDSNYCNGTSFVARRRVLDRVAVRSPGRRRGSELHINVEKGIIVRT